MKKIALKFNKIWILIIGSAFSSLSMFISFPLINIYAMSQFNLSTIEVGLISGVMPITILCFSFFAGSFAEAKGYLNNIKFGIFLSSIAFLILTISFNIYQFTFALFLIGIGKTAFDNSIRASIIQLSKKNEIEKNFRLRYLLQNIGTAIGPLLGIFLYKKASGTTFIATTLLLLICLILITVTLNNNDFDSKSVYEKLNFKKNIFILKDPNLQIWIISGTLIIMAYGAYEELMPIIISKSNGTRPNFGFLIALNSVSVIISQFFIIKMLKKLNLKYASNLGFILFTIGFLLLTVKVKMFSMTIFAVIIFSIGESILFPCYDIIMGNIAPSDKRALYCGIGEIKQIGFFLGPVIGGLVLNSGRELSFFIFCSILIILGKIMFDKIIYKNLKETLSED